MKKAPIYTTTGDDGTTSLFKGGRVGKDDARVEAYGEVDELNAQIGVLKSLIPSHPQCEFLQTVQLQLFNIGADLATLSPVSEPLLLPESVKQLEQVIDELYMPLSPLNSFLLPGGNCSSAQANLCRTVARRVERRIVTLSHISNVESRNLVYINRLSDYFFALSRYLNNGDEKTWKKACI